MAKFVAGEEVVSWRSVCSLSRLSRVYVVYGKLDIVVGEAGQGVLARIDRMDPGANSTKSEMVELGGGGLAGGRSGKVLESAAVVSVIALVGVGELGQV